MRLVESLSRLKFFKQISRLDEVYRAFWWPFRRRLNLLNRPNRLNQEVNLTILLKII